MKKITLLLASMIGVSSFSQITMISSDFVSAGDEIITTYDSTSSITVTAAGANQTWDFSSLEDQKRDTAYGIDPTTAPQFAEFPDANVVLEIDLAGLVALSYIKKEATKAEIIGIGYNNTLAQFSNSQQIAQFPMNYNDRYEDYYKFIAKGPASDFDAPAFIDSIRLESRGTQIRHADAYGTAIMPTGSFDVLRTSDTTYDTTITYAKISGSWTVFDSSATIQFRHIYESNHSGVKVSLVSYDVSSGGTLNGRVNWEYVDPASSINENQSFDFSFYPNPAQNKINITSKTQINGYVITDLQGKIIRSNRSSNISSIDVSDLAKGSYVLTLISNEKTSSKLINKQ